MGIKECCPNFQLKFLTLLPQGIACYLTAYYVKKEPVLASYPFLSLIRRRKPEQHTACPNARSGREAKIQAQNDRAATNPTQNSSTYTIVSFQFTTNSIFPVKPMLSRNLLQILEFTSRLPCHVVMKKCKMVSVFT